MTAVPELAAPATAHQGIWFTELAGVAGRVHHLGLAIELRGALDEAALLDACDAVLRRHPALRCAVDDADGVPRLVPAQEPPPVLRAEWSPTLVAGEMARPYDLRRGPLARFVLAGSGQRHLLVFTAHHLVFDGISKEILARELAAAYAGEALPPLPAPPPADDDPAAARDFWRTGWGGPGRAVLPGLVRVPVAAEPGAAVEVRLDPPLRAALSAGADALGGSRFEVLLAAVHAVLHRYGNAELPVAVDLSTRTPDTTGHIGHFVNELPVAVPVAGGETFRSLVGSLRGRLREVYRHRRVPLAHVAGGMRPSPALTEVSVSYRRGGRAPDFPGLVADVDWLVGHGTARNALHLQIVDLPDETVLSLQYSPSAFAAGAAERIAGHLRTMLAGALDAPDTPIDELPLLPPDEYRRVVEEGHGTTVGYPPDATLVSLLAAQVARAPDAVAAVGPDGRALSYGELDGLSAALAARLAAAGVRRGDRVGVCLPRGLPMLVALLGVVRAGAAYVPVDPTHPAARRALILDAAAPAAVVTDSTLADLSTMDGTAPPPPGPDDPAYVMFTSGSTGRPKGVVVPHRALTNLLLAMRDALDAGPGDVWLALTSTAFDISIVELFLPLVVGARTVVAPDGAGRDGAAVLGLVRAHGVTHVQATPSGWRMLLAGGFGADGPEPVVALAGGEALPPPLARDLRARTARLVNVYGPTETTVWSTMDDLPASAGAANLPASAGAANVPAPADAVTIGRPLANTRAYLLDPAGRPVPLGLPGELCLGGAGVADGYLGRPDLTAERFVPDPFAPGRIYRTGDLARVLPDGRLAFLGRLDGQVKIRGHRVEPGEIEARLLEYPGVSAAAVVARAADGEAELVGYVVPGADPPEPAALRAHLAATLPAAMVPGAWVLLDALPLTPNGKLDRAALPPSAPAAPPVAAPAAAREGAPAGGDPVAAAIRDIWADVLQVPDIGPEDDLFDLGGHSLTITRIMARMNQQLGIEVPLEVFFDTPTIAGVLEALQRRPTGLAQVPDREYRQRG
jgi:amino acid adenylation domain-containing protein